jgi:hypothetical protein
MNRTIRRRGSISLLAALALAAGASAQDATPAQPPKQPEQPATPPPEKQPTLDELLGLPSAPPREGGKPRPESVDPSKADLERKLSVREAAEQFKVAVDLMGETADRIQTSRDTGLTTQRMQEDIVRKLDQLIKAAEQQQQQRQRSRSSSRSQNQQQNQQPNQPQQGQRREAGKGEPQEALEPPPAQAPNPTPGTAARGAAWGALPEHIRNPLMQGDAEKYSSLYQKITEAYYRRLAEETNK